MQDFLNPKINLKDGSRPFRLIKHLGDSGAATNWISIIKPFIFKPADLYSAVHSLERSGLISRKNKKIKLSKRGHIEYIKIKIKETEELDDDKGCVVVFDIPEKQRKIRKSLNKLLKELVFLQIQKSVWISQFNNAEPLKKLLIMLEIKKWVRIFTGKEE
jgi:DNA-binding transcriptional regulator PaaX